MCSIRYVSFLKAVYHYTCVPCSYSSLRSSWKTIWTKKIQPPTNQPAKWMGMEEEERGRETLMLKTELEVNSRNKCNMETEIERYALAVIWLVFKEIIVRHTIPEIYITIHQVSNHAYALHRCQAYSSCSNGVCLCTSLVFLSRLFISLSLSLALYVCGSISSAITVQDSFGVYFCFVRSYYCFEYLRSEGKYWLEWGIKSLPEEEGG